MENYTAVIGTYMNLHYPPLTFGCSYKSLLRTKDCPEPGIDSDLIDFIYHAAKIPYIVKDCGDDFGHVFENGTTTGCFAGMSHGAIDTLVTSYIITDVRKEYFSFSIPIHTFTYVVVTPMNVQPTWSRKLTRLVAPFASNLWIVLAIFMLLVIVVKKIYVRWNLTNNVKNSKIEPETVNQSFPLRQMLTTWAMTSMLCMGLYRSFLLSTMVLDTINNIPIANYADLVDAISSGRVQLLISTQSRLIPEHIENHPPLLALRQALVENPFVWMENMTEILMKVEEGEGVWIDMNEMVSFMIKGTCNVHTFSIQLTEEASTTALIFNKDVPFIDKLSHTLIGRQAEIAFIKSQYTGEYERHQYCASLKTNMTPSYLRIETLVSVFVFLLGGFVCGTFMLCFEKVIPMKTTL